MVKFRNSLLLLGLVLCAARLWAAPVVVPDGHQNQVAVAKSMDVLVDPEGQWDLRQVREDFSSRFTVNTAEEPNFGFTSSVIWLRFTLDTRKVMNQSWYLVERYPILDHITLYAPRLDGGYDEVAMGDTLPFHMRMMNHRAFIFPLNTDRPGPRTYYVKVSGKGAINLSPVLYNSTGLVEYTYRDTLLYGVFYGCLLIMVIYNALLALSLREPVYLYFVAFLVGMVIFILNINGFGLQFVWPLWPKLNEYYWLGIYISCPALAMYSRAFLELRVRFPRYDRVLRHYLIGALVLLAVQLMIAPPWSYYLSTALVGVTVVLFSWLGWMVLSQGYRAARLYVLAWWVFMLLVFIFILGIVGWLPYTSFITILPHLATLWVVVMLSLALGDRIRFLERERNSLFEESRRNLERHVAEMERVNRDKSTFLQYVSHELNTPINWLGAADTLSDDDDRRDTWNLVRKGQQRLMGLVSTSLRYFDLSDRESPTLITVCDPYWLVEALTTSRWECLEQSGLKVQNRVSERLRVRANESELQEVLAMALDNAIRFSPAGEVIDISSQRLDGVGEIRMRDNGRGVGADQLESLFEPFFIMGSRHHEDGFGLSLAMARVMIEQSGGRIWAESTGEGQGFTLVIRLPLAE